MAAASRTGAAQTGKNSAGPGRFPVAEPGFVELFTPKSIAVLREGYGFADPRSDIVAGMTVAIVALPLSMAIAIASGVTPERGLYTAIVGGGSGLGAWRQPVSDRRTGGCVHRPGGGNGRGARPGRAAPCHHAVRAGARGPYHAAMATGPDVAVCRISGAFFFGTAASAGMALDNIGDRPRPLVIDFSGVPLLDSTAAPAA